MLNLSFIINTSLNFLTQFSLLEQRVNIYPLINILLDYKLLRSTYPLIDYPCELEAD